MKKVLFFLMTICLLFSLTSCQVNWFDRHYDVPWWVIAIPTVLFCAIVFFIAGKCLASKEYACPECGHTFHPKWYQATFSAHIGDERLFKCPHCGKRNFCSVSHSSR